MSAFVTEPETWRSARIYTSSCSSAFPVPICLTTANGERNTWSSAVTPVPRQAVHYDLRASDPHTLRELRQDSINSPRQE